MWVGHRLEPAGSTGQPLENQLWGEVGKFTKRRYICALETLPYQEVECSYCQVTLVIVVTVGR